ncbi:unnamed protein product [Calypogeia fissa]
MSFKQQCAQLHRRYILRLMRKLRDEGVLALGPGATDEDVVRVMAKLRKETIGEMVFQPKKPKAASNMLVNELREELAGQGLPTDGTRPVLYQRVQKARRINRARGRPLWVPEPEEEMEEDTEEDNVDIFLQRLTLENDHTEFWRKRLTGEIQDADLFQVADGLGRGHNLLLFVKNAGDYVQLGTTIDDAIGEAYDKSARWLGLDLNRGGGPALEEIARGGNPKSVPFPVPLRGVKYRDHNLSYAGLKTQVQMAIEAKNL